jgi:hypothetical protein
MESTETAAIGGLQSKPTAAFYSELRFNAHTLQKALVDD